MLLFSFFLNIFLCQGYELSGEIALKNNHYYYYYYYIILTFANAFCFHALSWVIDTVCLFQILFCIIHSAFNLLVIPNYYVHTDFLMKGLGALLRNSTYK